MVKRGLADLDVIARARDAFEAPIFAYSTSGEYAMLEAAAAIGAGGRDAMIMDTPIAFEHAGCAGILTCHALEIARKPN